VIVPDPVYRATDRKVPRWRFIVGVVNTTRRRLVLGRLRVKTTGTEERQQRTYLGEQIEEIVRQGDPSMGRKEVVAVELSDTGTPKHPQRVAVSMKLRMTDGATFSVSRTVRIVEYPTVWMDFPLTGRWMAVNAREDMHCLGRQFGFDLIAPEDFPIHEHPPRRKLNLRDFGSFGKPILSPLEGTVVSCSSHYTDFRPTPSRSTYGSRVVQLRRMVGNHVIIATDRQQYLLLAHMRRASVSVQRGDVVRRGQKVGEVGNSGNTTGPHLHVELMDRLPDLAGSKIDVSGLPFGFRQISRVRSGRTQALCQCVPGKLDVVERR